MGDKKLFGLLLIPLLAFFALAGGEKQGGAAEKPEGMIRVPAGRLTLFYDNSGEKEVTVESFYLDARAVTNAEFLVFVKANPEWSRSRVPKLFADTGYLKHWKSDFEIGNERIGDSPVTNVSWYAANAYSKWKGKRLPELTEWEYAADNPPVDDQRSLKEIILDWYSKPSPKELPQAGSAYTNRLGLKDMHGLIWEWVGDFNSVVMGSDSRSNTGIQRELFCASASFGAADREDYAAFMRYAFRGSLKGRYTVSNLGFRCAKDL